MMTPGDVLTFEQALRIVAAHMRAFRANLSPRELLISEASAHAAHAEEAIAVGDGPRSEAHIRALGDTMRKLAALT